VQPDIQIVTGVYQAFTLFRERCCDAYDGYAPLQGAFGGYRVTPLDSLDVDLTVVLGKTRMPLQRVLRMGRGAVVGFTEGDADFVEILANDHPIARGQISVRGATIAIEVTELVRKVDFDDTPGATIGGNIKAETLRTSA
jgi:flagellar motor switch protein FliN/FliY